MRPAQPDDAEAVARMACASSVADGGRPSCLTAARFRRDGFGERPAFAAMVAEIDDRVVGYAVYYPGYDTDSATRGAYLADLYVAEDRRRLGAGRALVAAIARRCRTQGGRWLFWSVLKRNRGARRFYRKIAPELRGAILCAAFGETFDRIADMAD